MDDEKMFRTSYKKRPIVYFFKNGDLIADIETDNVCDLCQKARQSVMIDRSEITGVNTLRLTITVGPDWSLKDKEKKLMVCLEKIFST